MPEWILQLLAAGGAGIGAYTAIRADLARLYENMRHVEKTANDAHSRLDRIFEEAAN